MDIFKSLSWIRAWDGAAATPSISFGSDPDTGFYSPGTGYINVTLDGVRAFQFGPNAFAIGSALDVQIQRDAANTLALKNGDTAQTFRVYGATTGSKYLKLTHTGSVPLIGSQASDPIAFAGGIIFASDNTYDIGANGTTRPKDIYCAGGFYGNGANITGIAGATGGVSNTVNTNIIADSDANGSGQITFTIGATDRWIVQNAGHFVPNTNNSYDIGTSSLNVRGIYATQFSGGQGAALAGAVYTARLNSGYKVLASVQDSAETSAVSLIDLATTWNNAGNTPTAIKLDVLDTASNAGSILLDLKVGGTSKFKVTKVGSVIAAAGYYFGSQGLIGSAADGVFVLYNALATDFGRLAFGGATDQFPSLGRSGTTLSVLKADGSEYASMRAGYFIIQRVSGTVTPATTGDIRLPKGVAINAYGEGASDDHGIVIGSKNLTDNVATSLFEIALPAGTRAGGQILYTIHAADASDHQAHSGIVCYSVVNKAGTYTKSIIEEPQSEQNALSTGTLSDSFTILDGANKVTIQLNANTSLTATTLKIYYKVINNSAQAITLV